jgi:hypothetical protein
MPVLHQEGAVAVCARLQPPHVRSLVALDLDADRDVGSVFAAGFLPGDVELHHRGKAGLLPAIRGRRFTVLRHAPRPRTAPLVESERERGNCISRY